MYFNEQNTEGYSLEELRDANQAVRDAINQHIEDYGSVADKEIDSIVTRYFYEYMIYT